MDQSKFTEGLPGWFQDLRDHPEKYYLVLTDDYDSLFSCELIKQKVNRTSWHRVDVEGYFGFDDGLYLTDGALGSDRIPIYVDLAVTKGLSFDNHRMPKHLMSPDAINPNRLIDCDSSSCYCQKYAGSTYLVTLSAFEHDISMFSNIELMRAASFDSFYKSYYHPRFGKTARGWLKTLNLNHRLTDFLDNHNESDFEDFKQKYKLDDKILINKQGYLQTGWLGQPLLPDEKFRKVFSCKRVNYSKGELNALRESTRRTIFNLAETYTNNFMANIII